MAQNVTQTNTEAVKHFDPGEFYGYRIGDANEYMMKCELWFPKVGFTSREDKIGAVTFKVRGPRARPWAEGVLKQLSDGTLQFANWDAFKQAFLTRFGHHNLAQDSHDKLHALCNDDVQKNRRTISYYNSRFSELAANAPIDDATKLYYYRKGLPNTVRVQLNKTSHPTRNLAEVMTAAQKEASALEEIYGPMTNRFGSSGSSQYGRGRGSSRGSFRGGRNPGNFSGQRFQGTCNMQQLQKAGPHGPKLLGPWRRCRTSRPQSAKVLSGQREQG